MTLRVIKPDYPFLAHPPQKKRPVQPLPPPPVSPAPSTFAAITAWASRVQPGSPVVSLSPRCRPSARRGRRLSAVSIVPSASFLHVGPTPTTPSVRDFKPDLTTVGYTSVFLQLPNTPISATLAPVNPNRENVPPIPSPRKSRGLTRFRSLSALRRGRSTRACPTSPTKMRAKAAASIKHKKAKYPMRPPPLSNELSLMQFADGGNMDDNIKRLMQEREAGADVFRDANGGLWRDQDEEWEYAHLLADGDERPWVTFGCTSPRMDALPGEEQERRVSVSTQDSDLDPVYVVHTDAQEGDDLALFTTRTHGTSVLALPARPRRAAKHLRKPEYLVGAAFAPRGASVYTASKPKGKARPRPAPLKLVPPSPASKLATNFPVDADRARRDFIEASFQPVVSALITPLVTVDARPPEGRVVGKKPVLNMMGLFRSRRDEMSL